MKKHLFAALLLGTTACSGPTTSQEPASVSAAKKDKAPAQAVRQFLNWYSVHMDSLAAISLVALDETASDSLEHFVADYKAIDHWLSMVQHSHSVSPQYLHHWRTHFHNYADTLRLQAQGGPPIGFDYDFIMLSQEPDTKAADLRVGTYTTTFTKDNRATVQARGPRHDTWQEGLDFSLSKTSDNQWRIDSIGNASKTF